MPVISTEFNQLVQFYGGLVKHTLSTYDYADFAEMRADFEATGSIKVNTEHSDGTIFGSPEVNWLFRAWHDYCHLLVNAGFDAQGERMAASEQIRQVRAHPGLTREQKTLFTRIIDIEINGQVDYYIEHNDFPSDQYAFFVGEYARRYGEKIPETWYCADCEITLPVGENCSCGEDK
jgi:hypothetical protein